MFYLELSILKLLAPLVRPHLSGMANINTDVYVTFDPPGFYERKNWKHLIDSPYGSQSSTVGLSLGLNWNAEVQSLDRVDVVL